MPEPVSLKSDAAELLMTEMLELRRMQISAKNNDSDADAENAIGELAAPGSDGSGQEFPNILVSETPLIPPIFETQMPPRPLLELAKEGYEALQAMARDRAGAA